MRMGPEGWICSFCGKAGSKETRLAGGLGAMICLDCIERYSALVSSDPEKKRITIQPWEGMSDRELLDTLPLLARSVAQGHSLLTMWVEVLRNRKISWAQIGSALGVTRQAAWERFARSMSDAEETG